MPDPSSATGYTATCKESCTVIQGEPLRIRLTPTGKGKDSQFPEGASFRLTRTFNGKSSQVDVGVPRTGGKVEIALPKAGRGTVSVSSQGLYDDPAPFAVTVLPGLIDDAPASEPPTGDVTQGPTAPHLALCNSIQGRKTLVFYHGERVGFHLPYAVYGNSVKITRWQVRRVDRFDIVAQDDCQVQKDQSARVLLNLSEPGHYSLFLLDESRPARQSRYAGVFPFCLLPRLIHPTAVIWRQAVNQYNYQSGQDFYVMSDADGTARELPLNAAFRPDPSGPRFVRTVFRYTPAQNRAMTLGTNDGVARITVDGLSVQPFQQFAQYPPNRDQYGRETLNFRRGQTYEIVLEQFVRPGDKPALLGASIPAVFSDEEIRGAAKTPGMATVTDYPAHLGPLGGELGHNNPFIARMKRGAGALVRFPVSNQDALGSIVPAVKQHLALGCVGKVDPARAPYCVIVAFEDLGNVWEKARNDRKAPAPKRYSAEGVTEYLKDFLAQTGIDPRFVLVSAANEFGNAGPGVAAYYGGVTLPTFYAAVKAANPRLRVVAPSLVTMGQDQLNWFDATLAAAKGQPICDAIDTHPYNNLEADKAATDFFVGRFVDFLNRRGLADKPRFQTEQGTPPSYGSEWRPMEGVKELGMRRTVLPQHGFDLENDYYWYAATNFFPFPCGNIGSSEVYPSFCQEMVFADVVFSRKTMGPVDFGSWSKLLAGNVYAGETGGTVSLITSGCKALDVPVTLAGDLPGDAFTLRDWQGRDRKISVTGGGQAVIPISYTPSYALLPPGVSLQVNLPDIRENAAKGATFSSPTPVTGGLKLLNDGSLLGTSRPVEGPGPVCLFQQSTLDEDVLITCDFGEPKSINLAIFDSERAYQQGGGFIIAGDLQKPRSEGEGWETFCEILQSVAAMPVPRQDMATRLDELSAKENLTICRFDAVTTPKVRLRVKVTNYGGVTSKGIGAYSPQSNQPEPFPQFREIAFHHVVWPTLTAAGGPVITSALQAELALGQGWTYQITADGDPAEFSAEGLPPGLILLPGTPWIIGALGEPGQHAVTLVARNAGGEDRQTLVLVAAA